MKIKKRHIKQLRAINELVSMVPSPYAGNGRFTGKKLRVYEEAVKALVDLSADISVDFRRKGGRDVR